MIAWVCFLALVLAATTAGAAPGDSDAIARGAYLAAAAGCGGCHTDAEHGGEPYAGGRVIVSEYGAIATPNLTPDKATGIGRWSDADFVRAMRWGIAPDDSHYVPVFPFRFYSRLTERDLADLKAFLDSLAAVAKPDIHGAGSTALWPRARAAVAIAAMPSPGPPESDPDRDAIWNRGVYLVATIGRCGECHTPPGVLGAPDAARFLGGGEAGPDGKLAPNITPDRATGIGNWSDADIVQVLTDGHTPDFDEVGGTMVEIVKNTARLSDADRRAIAVFLASVAPVSSPRRK